MRELTLEERDRVVEIFNDVLSRTPYPQRISLENVPAHQIFGDRGLLDLGYFNQIDPNRMDDPFFQVFSMHSVDRKGKDFSCYHFKRLERAIDLIESHSVALNTLFSNRDNDYAEFEEFFRRYGPLHNLIPRTYKQPAEGEFGVVIPRERAVDDLKNKIYVACFTTGYDDPRFWKEYTHDKGLCFRFRFYGFRNDVVQNFGELKRTVQQLYQLREICYDQDGYIYDFINEIEYRLGQELGFVLFRQGTPIAAQFYKRSRFAWEREIRLAVDVEFVERGYAFQLRKHLKVIQDGSRQSILVPIDEPRKSPFFGLELQDVFCSKDLAEVNQIKQLVEQHFPSAKVWEYNEWSAQKPYIEA